MPWQRSVLSECSCSKLCPPSPHFARSLAPSSPSLPPSLLEVGIACINNFSVVACSQSVISDYVRVTDCDPL